MGGSSNRNENTLSPMLNNSWSISLNEFFENVQRSPTTLLLTYVLHFHALWQNTEAKLKEVIQMVNLRMRIKFEVTFCSRTDTTRIVVTQQSVSHTVRVKRSHSAVSAVFDSLLLFADNNQIIICANVTRMRMNNRTMDKFDDHELFYAGW